MCPLHPCTVHCIRCVIDVALALLHSSYPRICIINQPLESAGSLSCFLFSPAFSFLLLSTPFSHFPSAFCDNQEHFAIIPGLHSLTQRKLFRTSMRFLVNFNATAFGLSSNSLLELSLNITRDTIPISHHYSQSMIPICCARSPGHLSSTSVHLSTSWAPIGF